MESSWPSSIPLFEKKEKSIELFFFFWAALSFLLCNSIQLDLIRRNGKQRALIFWQGKKNDAGAILDDEEKKIEKGSLFSG